MTTSELVRRLRGPFQDSDAAKEAADRLEALEEEVARLRDYMHAAIQEINEGDVGFERRAKKWLADGLTARAALKEGEG